jgi:hypothetical protein
MFQHLNVMLLLTWLLIDVNQIECNKIEKAMSVFESIKALEKLILADEVEKKRKQDKQRQMIFQVYLASRVISSNILKDFYSGRY